VKKFVLCEMVRGKTTGATKVPKKRASPKAAASEEPSAAPAPKKTKAEKAKAPKDAEEEVADPEVAWEDAEFDEFMDSYVLRGKGLLNGCESLAAVVQRLRDAADVWASRAAEGFELKGRFDGDVGIVVHPDGKRLFEYLYEDPETEGKKKPTSGKKKAASGKKAAAAAPAKKGTKRK
jgi:hypothetical protein